jgi:hypothetical protein
MIAISRSRPNFVIYINTLADVRELVLALRIDQNQFSRGFSHQYFKFANDAEIYPFFGNPAQKMRLLPDQSYQ